MTSNTITLKIIHWSISWLHFWLMSWQSLKMRNNISIVLIGLKCFIQNASYPSFVYPESWTFSEKKKKKRVRAISWFNYSKIRVSDLEVPSKVSSPFFFFHGGEKDGGVPSGDGEGRERLSKCPFLIICMRRVFLHWRINLDMIRIWDTFPSVWGSRLMVKCNGWRWRELCHI